MTQAEKLQKTLTSLYNLSIKGNEGEKINAEKLLLKLLKKHNLTIDEVIDEKKTDKFFKYSTNQEKQLIVNIIYKITNDERNVYSLVKRKEVVIPLNKREYIEAVEFIQFHKDNFRKERKKLLDDFTDAYVHKYNLFSDNQEPCSTEEIELDEHKIERIRNLMNNIEEKSFYKKLHQ